MSKFKAIFAILGAVSLFPFRLTAQPPVLSDEQQSWLAERLFENECGGQPACLTAWNSGENFPSLGIGHFIWYRAGQVDIYTETFPALLSHFRDSGIHLPDWLANDPDPDAPWTDRAHFYQQIDSPAMTALRELLMESRNAQAAFVVERQRRALPALLAQARPEQRADLERLYLAIESEAPPLGAYALIDYVHFKGEGTAPEERYQGQGWGLLQVLEGMLEQEEELPLLRRFANAATEVLARRVALAPAGRDEVRWLTGWINRVSTYVPPPPY